jgi:hypothetical protein
MQRHQQYKSLAGKLQIQSFRRAMLPDYCFFRLQTFILRIRISDEPGGKRFAVNLVLRKTKGTTMAVTEEMDAFRRRLNPDFASFFRIIVAQFGKKC